MRAEEARELAKRSREKIDISRIIEGIKDVASKGEVEITFSNLTDGQIKAILKLGYETESYDNIHIIKW